MPIPVHRCDAALGAEIVFDLAQPIDDAAFSEIERHFHDNIVVFFRDQHFSEEQQIAFSRRLGVGGEQKPIGGCGMGVRHTVFEPVVA